MDPRVADAGIHGEAPLEADLPAHLLTQRPPALRGDAPRKRPRRDPAGLQHDRPPVRGERGGTRVVFPAPGGATTTTAPFARTASTIEPM